MGIFDTFKGKAEDLKDKATDLVDQHGDKVGEGLDKAGDFVDEKTGGKYGEPDRLSTPEGPQAPRLRPFVIPAFGPVRLVSMDRAARTEPARSLPASTATWAVSAPAGPGPVPASATTVGIRAGCARAADSVTGGF
jgi:hypothetical protein